jgi:Bacterial Ig-like domain (group 3)
MIKAGRFRYGQAATITIQVATAERPWTGLAPRPTGTVTLYNHGVELGTATLGADDIPGAAAAVWTGQLAPGYGDFSATYGGDATYAPTTLTGGIGWAQNALVAFTYPDHVTSGLPFQVSAKVTAVPGVAGTPTGTVTFYKTTSFADPIEVSLDASGNASATLTAPVVSAPTSLDLFVDYSGDGAWVLWQEQGTTTVAP